MADQRPERFKRLIEATTGLFQMTTIQGAACSAPGGLIVLIMMLRGKTSLEAFLWFFPTVAVTLLPVRYIFSPECVLERKVDKWKRWMKKGILEENEFSIYMFMIKRWYVVETKYQLGSMRPKKRSSRRHEKGPRVQGEEERPSGNPLEDDA
jgi:hypothetical protein